MLYLVNKSTEHPSYPARKDKFRIKDYWSYMVIKPYTSDFKKPGVEFGLTYFDNPGVNIPTAITTWVAMRAMPDFLTNLRKAAKKYREFCNSTGHICICNKFSSDECHTREKREIVKSEKENKDQVCNKPYIGCVPGYEVMTSPSAFAVNDIPKDYLYSS